VPEVTRVVDASNAKGGVLERALLISRVPEKMSSASNLEGVADAEKSSQNVCEPEAQDDSEGALVVDEPSGPFAMFDPALAPQPGSPPDK
jgi:hypothetical protein